MGNISPGKTGREGGFLTTEKGFVRWWHWRKSVNVKSSFNIAKQQYPVQLVKKLFQWSKYFYPFSTSVKLISAKKYLCSTFSCFNDIKFHVQVSLNLQFLLLALDIKVPNWICEIIFFPYYGLPLTFLISLRFIIYSLLASGWNTFAIALERLGYGKRGMDSNHINT